MCCIAPILHHVCTAPIYCCPHLESTRRPSGTALEGARHSSQAVVLPVLRQQYKGKNAPQQTSSAMSVQAFQLRTVLPVAMLLWLHQVTVSQNGTLEDARKGQRDRHSLRNNTPRLHAAPPCMSATVNEQQQGQSCMDRLAACAGDQRPQTAGRSSGSAA